MNPFQPAAADDFGPGHGNLGVAAKDVGFEQFRGDSLLAGVDDFLAGGGGADLVEVARFEGVAEDDTHKGTESGVDWFALTKGISAIRVAARGVA